MKFYITTALLVYNIICISVIVHYRIPIILLWFAGACPGGGGQGALPPPLEIEKQKKKKVIRANLKLFHLYFATFLVENIIFSVVF